MTGVLMMEVVEVRVFRLHSAAVVLCKETQL